MHYGCNGKILRVDLSAGTWRTETFDDSFRRLYLGGWGLIAYYLLRELEPGIDPLGPQNKLIFAAGTVTGAAVGGSGRSAVGAKSPLTGGFGEADVGGWWGAELVRAGYDAIIVEGRAAAPVYLWVHDGQVEIRPAEHLWGTLTARAQAMLHDELGDHNVRVAQIGPAGERLSPIAAVMHDINRAAGRTGMGAVMGSKNLKAIAVRGHGKPSAADPAALTALAKAYADGYTATFGKLLHDEGTAGVVAGQQASGGLPSFNFQKGTFDEGWREISGAAMNATILKERDNCFACPVHCKRVVEIQEGRSPVDAVYGGPEYETIGSFGSSCGVKDLGAVARANQLCNAYGLDTISAGVTIAWAMECFDRGLLSSADTGGVELRFGDAEAMLRMTELMGQREGFGRLLSEGSRRAAQAIGRGTAAYAVQVKGQEVPMHEPRAKYALGIGYALSPTGADHMHNMHDTNYTTEAGIAELRRFGITEPLPIDDLGPAKMRIAAIQIPWSVMANMLGFCSFVTSTYERAQLVEMVRAVTGWDVSVEELTRAGERAYTLARAFNLREGFTSADDALPAIFSQPFAEGPTAGNRLDPQVVEQAKRQLYTLLGWDAEAGIPTRERLEELGVAWAADALDRAGLYAQHVAA